MPSRTQFDQDALALLGYERYSSLRPQLGKLYERVQRDEARKAIATQSMLDATTDRQYGFGQLRRAAGLGPSGGDPWSRFVDSAGRFHLPSGIKNGLKQMGFDSAAVESMQQMAAAKLGTYAEQQATFQGGLGREQMPTALRGDQTAPAAKYDESKRQLFLRVQEALAGAKTDEAKQRVLRVAFGGPGGEELLKQFGSQAQAEATTGAPQPGLATQAASAAREVGSGIGTAFGQLMGALGAGGDVVRSSIGVLLGSKDERGEDLTAGDIGESALNLLRAGPNIATLGLAGATNSNLRIDERAPGMADILGSARKDIPGALRLIQEGRRQGSGPGHAAAGVAGFGLDILTDPLSYVTFGAGGLGGAATKTVGGITSRLAKLLKIGVGADDATRLARLGEAEFAKEFERLSAGVGDDVLKAAAQDARAAEVKAETIHHAMGFKGYEKWLAENYGVDASAIFPKAFAGGTKADLLAHGARGGISLRAGRLGGINLTTGTGALRGVKPLTAWWLEPQNSFTRIGSKLLDQIAETFHYGAGSERGLTHRSRGLLNAVMSQSHRSDAVRAQGRSLRERVTGVEEHVRRAFRDEPDADLKIISLLEEGDASPYAALKSITPQVTESLNTIRAAIDAARDLARVEGVDIATLRDLLDNDSTVARYFPHRIKADHITEIRRSRRGPDIVGPARARTIRKGALLTGPTGARAKVAEGTFREIQEITERLYGERALVEDPFLAAKGYIAAVTHAAAVNKLFTGLAERGLIAPSTPEMIGRLNVTQGLVGPGDPIRHLWADPEELATKQLAQARQARTKLQENLAVLLEKRADALENRARNEEFLEALSSRKLEHDKTIEALRLSVAHKRELKRTAKVAHNEAIRDAGRAFKAEQREAIRLIRAEIKGVRTQKAEIGKALAQLKRNRTATLRAIDERYQTQLDNLALTPTQVRDRLEGEIRGLADSARSGREEFMKARDRIQAIRNRVAKLESDELAKVTHDRMVREAFAAVSTRHGAVLAKQRSREAVAADLNDRVALAQDRLADARRAGGSTAAIERQLEDLVVNRKRVLEAAEAEGAEVGNLAEALSAAEGAMRLADLREAQNLATRTAATFEIGRGMTTKIALPIARLLGYHAADLAREARHMLAYSPRLRFLEQAATDFDRASLGAIASASNPIGEAFDSIAARYQRQLGERGDEILDSWVKAVGGADHAYDEAIRENSRQMSAVLAREIDLQERVSRLKTTDPISAEVGIADDDLNFFAAQLDQDVRQLEAWIDNRPEIRKAMTTTALAARAAMKESAGLRKAMYTAQRTLEADVVTAVEAATEALSDARIFRLMTPQLEHLSAVVGKVPFIDKGYAVPKEILGVVNRLLSEGEGAQRELIGVLNLFNSFWKRGVLLTPGSVFRRIFGNTYNAVVLAGVSKESFRRALDAYSFVKGAHSIDDISDPTAQRYMRLALEQNLFEGQTTALAAEERGFKRGIRHPFQAAEGALFAQALRGEDIARLAQFIEGLERGMTPEAARLWTGKYHFFNHELTSRERRILRPLYPFYSYIRNNTALQFYTLFHNPGRVNVYGHLMHDAGSEPRGEQEPNWLVQQGGFPLPFGPEGAQRYLMNTLVDTSPLAAAHNLMGFEQEGPGAGFDPSQSDLVTSTSPLLGALGTFLFNQDFLTGQRFDRVSPSNAMQAEGTAYGLPYIQEAMRALGVVKPDGTVSPRWNSILSDLLPIGARAQRITGGGTPSQQEQRLEYLIGVMGPNVYANTTRAQNAATRARVEAIERLLATDPNRPTPEDVNKQAREARVREQIELLLRG